MFSPNSFKNINAFKISVKKLVSNSSIISISQDYNKKLLIIISQYILLKQVIKGNQ